jgi:hypothetical protein
VPDEVLRRQCAYDIAVTSDDAFAESYRAVHEVVSVGGGSVAVGEKVGPDRLDPGQEKIFTVAGGTDFYFASDTECSADAAVYWRVTGPDGKETLSVGMCEDVGRWHSATPGTWRIVVTVAADAGQGGPYAFRVLEAGGSRRFDVTLPATVADGRPRGAGTLTGAGAEDRFRFAGLAGDEVTVKSTVDCAGDDPLYWGLETPDGFVVTLRTRACEDLGAQTLTADGTWSSTTPTTRSPTGTASASADPGECQGSPRSRGGRRGGTFSWVPQSSMAHLPAGGPPVACRWGCC